MDKIFEDAAPKNILIYRWEMNTWKDAQHH